MINAALKPKTVPKLFLSLVKKLQKIQVFIFQSVQLKMQPEAISAFQEG